MYTFDAVTGSLLRQFKTGSAIVSSPAINNGTLYFGSNDRRLYAINIADDKLVWRYKAEDGINSAPLLVGDMVYVTSSDQYLHAIKTSNGVVKWKYRLPYSALPNSVSVVDNTLYLPSGDTLYALQPGTGLMRWMVKFPSTIATPPVAEGGTVYAIDRSQHLYAISAQRGREIWAKPVKLSFTPAAAPTISGSTLYIPTDRNAIYALSREDGKTIWQYSVEPASNKENVAPPTFTSFAAPLAIANGTLFALSDDGSLSAFRADAVDTSPPIAEKFYPQPGSTLNGTPPLTFAATVADPGSGLDRDSVKLLLDDQPQDIKWEVGKDLVYARTSSKTGAASPPLSNGLHTLTITAQDWRGNVTEEKWSFHVDNSLPVSVNKDPSTPANARNQTPGMGQFPGGPPGANSSGRPNGRQGSRQGNRQGNRPRRPNAPPL